MKTIREIVLEVILTHPQDIITINEISDQLEGKIPIEQLRNTIQGIRSIGYITTEKTGSGSLGPAEYKIITREKIPRKKPNLLNSYRQLKRKKSISTIKEKSKEDIIESISELSMRKTGEVIYFLIHDLKKQFHELSTAYSDLQSTLNKEKSSFRIVLKEKENQITELKETLEVFRKRLRDQHNGNDGKTLKLNEVVTFVRRGQR